jgi:FHA domain
VNRYRLRFLLQELDLSGPRVVLGRSPECQITLDDPLVSRRHAAIDLGPTSAVISDLGSRNGVRINGVVISCPAPLAHNDRIRLGTQDLVFLVADLPAEALIPTRPTGRIKQCGACARPFPGETPVCPHCGSTTEAPPASPFEAVTDVMLEPDASWALKLLLDVIQRALDNGRPGDAERGFNRAQREVEARLVDGRVIDSASIARLATFAIELSRATATDERLAWVMMVLSRRGQLPEASFIDHIITLDSRARAALRPAVEALLHSWGAARINDDRSDATLRVQRLRSWLGAAA